MTLNFWRRSLTMTLAVTDFEIWKHESLDSRFWNAISCRLDMLSNHLSQAAREHTGLKADSYVSNFQTTLSFKLIAKLAEKYVMILFPFFVLCDVLFWKKQNSEITVRNLIILPYHMCSQYDDVNCRPIRGFICKSHTNNVQAFLINDDCLKYVCSAILRCSVAVVCNNEY